MTAQQRLSFPKSVLPPPEEFSVHIAIADLLRRALRPGWLWWHTPNGEERSKAAAGRLKAMGVMAGVSDFLLIKPEGARLHALELKRHGLRPTVVQMNFLDLVDAAGGRVAWVDSFDAAVTVLERWGATKGVTL
jgi:hypothetical protein